ncbi:hypothetical protein FS837_005864 [Tulasnella sp. UAMH 9824]|nr:hypothetical protein FS837_005864 [Tulasnella sp. UAMH 9824]
MARISSTLEIVSTAAKLFSCICDIPVLSPLKPLGSTLVTICDHVAALEGNKEAAIILAERVNRAVQVLVNRARDFDGAMPGNYFDDIQNLEGNFIAKVASAKVVSSRILSKFLSADFEARQTFQTVKNLVSKEANRLEHSEIVCPAIDPSALRVYSELDATESCSIQVGTYHTQAVVVRKYYTAKETKFAQDLRQRLDQTHPGIAGVIGCSNQARIILLYAEDHIDDIRRPWLERRIGPPIPSKPSGGGTAISVQSLVSFATPGKESSSPSGILAVKESDVLLRQLASVVRFLENMDVRVAWWKFKPSWVGLRENQQLVLVDWTQGINYEGEFEPRYAVHVIGLGFSDIIPNSFQNSGRLLEKRTRYYMHFRNIGQQRLIIFSEVTLPQSYGDQVVWTCSVTISASFNGYGLGIHTAQGGSKQAARDRTSLRALIALGIDINTTAN